MNYVKKYFACVVIISMLLSTATSSASQWSSYLPDSTTWQRAKEYAGSYITPAWQNTAKNYSPYAASLGLTALGSAISGIAPSGWPSYGAHALTALGAGIEPALRIAPQLIDESPQKTVPSTDLLYHTRNFILSTAGAMIPALIRAYMQGKIDTLTFKTIIRDPIVSTAMATAIAIAMALQGRFNSKD